MVSEYVVHFMLTVISWMAGSFQVDISYMYNLCFIGFVYVDVTCTGGRG
jgi:hypothetical protein